MNIESSDVENISKKFTSKVDDLWPVGEEYNKSKVTDFLSTKDIYIKMIETFQLLTAAQNFTLFKFRRNLAEMVLIGSKKYNQNLLDEGDRGIVHWVSEILWREFYRHIIYNFQKYQ